MWGMRYCRLVAAVGHLGLNNFVAYHTLDWLRIPFALVEFSPNSGVSTVEIMNSVVYGREERGRYACSWCLFHKIFVYHVLVSIICVYF
jgi:hypothetical protein